MSDDEGYLLANENTEAGNRFAAFADLFDPVTFRHLDGVGLTAGWRCWEVGAGGDSVPVGLSRRVGPTGRVLATDIDTTWLTAQSASRGFEVRRHDVAVDPPPDGPFDLVHARLVLVHLPRRAQALAAMRSVLRPGGWLVVEDADPALQPLTCPDEWGPAQELANRLRRGFRTLMASRGADLDFGRTVPRLLRDAGLDRVESDGYFPLASAACTALEAATVRLIAPQLLDAGLATEEEIAVHLRNVATGTMDLATAPLISAWGQVPTNAGTA